MENMEKIWEKSWKSHGIHEQNLENVEFFVHLK